MNRWGALALLLAIAAALALRVPGLATRPFHNDEAVNAVKVADLWEKGRYVYDPDEYHGPTLYYATLPFLWLSGAHSADELDDSILRLAPVCFGVGLVLLLLLLSDGLERHAVAWAAFFTAVSPAMVFYSRYFIHEMLLVFFSALTLGAGWRYTQSRSALWALVTGAGLGLMLTTKETFIITFVAMVLATMVTTWWTRRTAANHEIPNYASRITHRLLAFWNWKHAALALSAAFVVWLLLFSSFFTNFGGLMDSVRTYLPWLKRAGGHSPHMHPWNFYLQRLAWFHPAKGPVSSEALILILAALGAVVSLFKSRITDHGSRITTLPRFLAFHTIILTAAYSAISYKTPWCLLNFFLPMILLAGIGAASVIELLRAPWLKVIVVFVLLALTSQLGWQAWRASFDYAADRRNPYVYAQTAPDLLNLVNRLEGIARTAPAGHNTIVKIVAPESDYWPLPWYLRRFKRTGWYEKVPDDPFAPIVVVSSRLDARLDEKSDRKWIMAGLSELRPGKFLELYVELELWKKYVATLPPNRD
jgi:uncharacterized protein (TIGR03663 family)